MVDALPYLVDYPYGCTEQTLNRFLPTVITQILLASGLILKAIQEKRMNLNAQEIGDDAERAKRWHATTAIRCLTKTRSAGWSRKASTAWWRCSSPTAAGAGSPATASIPHTTAVVVHGLQIAVQNDVALVPGVVERGVDWLKRYQDSRGPEAQQPAQGAQAEAVERARRQP